MSDLYSIASSFSWREKNDMSYWL